MQKTKITLSHSINDWPAVGFKGTNIVEAKKSPTVDGEVMTDDHSFEDDDDINDKVDDGDDDDNDDDLEGDDNDDDNDDDSHQNNDSKRHPPTLRGQI